MRWDGRRGPDQRRGARVDGTGSEVLAQEKQAVAPITAFVHFEVPDGNRDEFLSFWQKTRERIVVLLASGATKVRRAPAVVANLAPLGLLAGLL